MEDSTVSVLLLKPSHQARESNLRVLLEADDIFLCQDFSVEEASC